MSEPTPAGSPPAEPAQPDPPPETGVPAVDQAVAPLAELGDEPLQNHHERLAAAHAALHDALDSDRS